MELELKLGVVGSRRRNSLRDKRILKEFLKKARIKFPTLTLVSGGCPKGADHFAEELSEELNIPIIIHYPDRSKLPENPDRHHFAIINYARNTLIAEDCEVLVALVADDRKGGTEDTIKKATKLGKKVILL